MREFVLAVRAIWDALGDRRHRSTSAGDFYTHTLMTPFFNPGPNPHGNPKIMLAAVGPLMTEAAGEVADGILCHAFSTERYMREATLPALERGFEKAGRTREGFEITAPAFVVAARHRGGDRARASRSSAADRLLRLDARLPAGARAARLGRAADRAERDDQARRVGQARRADRRRGPAHVRRHRHARGGGRRGRQRRYGDICTRITLALPPEHDPERWGALFEELRGD